MATEAQINLIILKETRAANGVCMMCKQRKRFKMFAYGKGSQQGREAFPLITFINIHD